MDFPDQELPRNQIIAIVHDLSMSMMKTSWSRRNKKGIGKKEKLSV